MSNLTGTSLGSIFNGYVPPGSVCDEMLAADGTVRPQWQLFVDSLVQVGTADAAKIDITHVPYKGEPQALIDLLVTGDVLHSLTVGRSRAWTILMPPIT